MNVIVTAGGTSEKIDEVRKITNRATGKLGSLLAAELYAQGKEKIEKIFYVCERGTVLPQVPCAEIVWTEGVADVKNALQKIVRDHKIDAAIHSMAVSDYAVSSVTTAEALADALARRMRAATTGSPADRGKIEAYLLEALQNRSPFEDVRKIPSDVDSLLLTLRRTPKIIGLFKAWQPDMLLVGFKLLSGVSEDVLLRAGFEIMRKNACDFVFANDADSLTDGGQTGYLLQPDGQKEKICGKPAIARRIAQAVLNGRKGRE